MNPGIADMGAALRVETVDDTLGEAAGRRCSEVVLSGEAGEASTLLPLVLNPLGLDLVSVPAEVEVEADG